MIVFLYGKKTLPLASSAHRSVSTAFHNLRRGVGDACAAITALRQNLAAMDQGSGGQKRVGWTSPLFWHIWRCSLFFLKPAWGCSWVILYLEAGRKFLVHFFAQNVLTCQHADPKGRHCFGGRAHILPGDSPLEISGWASLCSGWRLCWKSTWSDDHPWSFPYFVDGLPIAEINVPKIISWRSTLSIENNPKNKKNKSSQIPPLAKGTALFKKPR